MTSKPEILHMEQCAWAMRELCWIIRNTFARKRLLKGLGHQLKLLHSNTDSSACSAQDDWEKPKSVFSRHSLQYQTSLRINPQGRDLIFLNSSASRLGFYCGCPQAISNFCLCMWPAENHSAPSWGHAPLEPAVLTGSWWKQMTLPTDQNSS